MGLFPIRRPAICSARPPFRGAAVRGSKCCWSGRSTAASSTFTPFPVGSRFSRGWAVDGEFRWPAGRPGSGEGGGAGLHRRLLTKGGGIRKKPGFGLLNLPPSFLVGGAEPGSQRGRLCHAMASCGLRAWPTLQIPSFPLDSFDYTLCLSFLVCFHFHGQDTTLCCSCVLLKSF